MADEDLEGRLARAERSLAAHDMLLRALITHLAMTEPEAVAGIVAGYTRSKRYEADGAAGDLTREVAEELTELLEEVARSVRGEEARVR